MGGGPPDGEGPRGLAPLEVTVDGRHSPQTPIERNMIMSTHWGSADAGMNKRDQGLYCPPPEHSDTIRCDFSYHGLVSGGKAEFRDAALAKMVGSAFSGYPRDKSGTCSSGYGGKYGGGGIGGRYILRYRRAEVGRVTRGTREDQVDTW